MKKGKKEDGRSQFLPSFLFCISTCCGELVFWPISSPEKTFQRGLYCFYKMFLVNRAACDVAVNHIAKPLQADALKPNQFLLWAQLITLGANGYEDAKNPPTHQLISGSYDFVCLFVCLRQDNAIWMKSFISHLGSTFTEVPLLHLHSDLYLMLVTPVE